MSPTEVKIMTAMLILLTIVAALLWVATFGLFGYWLKKTIFNGNRTGNNAGPANREAAP